MRTDNGPTGCSLCKFFGIPLPRFKRTYNLLPSGILFQPFLCSFQMAMMMNLATLDGLRCLATFAVILYHTFWSFGVLFIPSTYSCMQSFRNIPLLGPTLFNVSFQMTLFWVISGFLCELQLNRMRHGSQNDDTTKTRAKSSFRQDPCQLGWLDYGRFLLNRFLRLYPLFFLSLVIMATAPNSLCTSQELKRNALFILQPNNPGEHVCVGAGWSVIVDVHGYLAISACFAVVPNKRYRRLLMISMYALSMLLVWRLSRQAPTNGFDPIFVQKFNKGHWLGLEYNIGVERNILVNQGLDPRQLYDFEFDRPDLVALRNYRFYHVRETYFTTITRHGSAVFLGSLLYLNLETKKSQREKRHGRLGAQYSYVDTCIWMGKVFSIAFVLHATDYFYAYSGLASYLMVDAALTIPPQLAWILANRFWSTLAPFTYGVYLVHSLLVITMAIPYHFENARRMRENDGDPVNEFGVSFVFTKTIQILIVSLLLSWILRYTIEWPFSYIRQKFVLKKDVAISKHTVHRARSD